MAGGAGLDEVHRTNLGAVLRQVHLHGALSRAELTTSLGLSRSTIGTLTAELSAAGLVSEARPGDRGRTGRPSLVVRPESRVFVYAVHFGADQVTAARVGLGGTLLGLARTGRARGHATAASLAGTVRSLVSTMPDPAPAGAVCVGGAAAVSGLVRLEDGSPSLSVPAGTLGTELADALGLARPAAVGSSADLGALAEHTRGCAVDSNDVIYLHGDAGVGGGVIAGGTLLAGRGGRGGEVGHMVVNAAGRRCGCGNHGCWETEIGEQALLRAAGRDAGGVEGIEGVQGVLAVVDAATWGDARAQAALRQVGDWLAFGVANLVNVLNADTVVFGGTLREVYQACAAQIRGGVDRRVLPAVRDHLRLRTPALGDDAPLMGAAELAFQGVLADPLRAGPV